MTSIAEASLKLDELFRLRERKAISLQWTISDYQVLLQKLQELDEWYVEKKRCLLRQIRRE